MEAFNRLTFIDETIDLISEVYNITKQFPKTELFGLTSQFRRAIISVAANLAEGYRKKGAKSKLHFYNIALCSLEECKIYCLISNRLKYGDLSLLYDNFNSLGKRIDKYCQAIQRNPIDH